MSNYIHIWHNLKKYPIPPCDNKEALVAWREIDWNHGTYSICKLKHFPAFEPGEDAKVEWRPLTEEERETVLDPLPGLPECPECGTTGALVECDSGDWYVTWDCGCHLCTPLCDTKTGAIELSWYIANAFKKYLLEEEQD